MNLKKPHWSHEVIGEIQHPVTKWQMRGFPCLGAF